MEKLTFNKYILEDYQGDPLRELPLNLSLVRASKNVRQGPKRKPIAMKKYRQQKVSAYPFHKPISKI